MNGVLGEATGKSLTYIDPDWETGLGQDRHPLSEPSSPNYRPHFTSIAKNKDTPSFKGHLNIDFYF